VLQSILWVHAPRAVVAALTVALGWVVVPVLPALRGLLGAPGVALLAGGGVLYTLGAVIYASRRPDPFPRVFGYHEVFHALVIAAAALHFAVAGRAVLALP
jgi:hemolysin III